MPSVRQLVAWQAGEGSMSFYHWLGAEAEEAACEQATLEQVIRESLPVVEGDE